jgi:biotin-(acetyl-CoA carboxylase) ligase
MAGGTVTMNKPLETLKEDLNKLAHQWEEQAMACDIIRLWNTHEDYFEEERKILLNRSKTFESCFKQLRRAMAQMEADEKDLRAHQKK